MPRPSPPTVCGLDIGSNTFSFTELEQLDGGSRVVNDLSHVVRLSEGLVAGGSLAEGAVARGLAVLEELVDRFELPRKPVRVVGTAVLRMARDPELFTVPAEEILGVPVEILSGIEEARLVARGAAHDLPVEGPLVIADVGGQSTEVSWRGPAGELMATSLPRGVVGLTETHFFADPPRELEVMALREEMGRLYRNGIEGAPEGRLVGVAGTATTLGSLELGLEGWQRDRVHGLELTVQVIEGWLARMLALTSAERTERHGVRPGRADVFPAGICAFLELARHLGRQSLVVSVNGLRVGAALSLSEGMR